MWKKKEVSLDDYAIEWIKEKISSTKSGQVVIYAENKRVSCIRFFSNENFDVQDIQKK